MTGNQKEEALRRISLAILEAEAKLEAASKRKQAIRDRLSRLYDEELEIETS